jgi:hypothetical protein
MTSLPPVDLSEEDAKLVTLARGARGRIGAAEGAAIRDDMGRTYAGATVVTEHLRLSALELAVASAIAAGARSAEAAAIVRAVVESMDVPDAAGFDALRDLAGTGVPVIGCGPDGAVTSMWAT